MGDHHQGTSTHEVARVTVNRDGHLTVLEKVHLLTNRNTLCELTETQTGVTGKVSCGHNASVTGAGSERQVGPGAGVGTGGEAGRAGTGSSCSAAPGVRPRAVAANGGQQRQQRRVPRRPAPRGCSGIGRRRWRAGECFLLSRSQRVSLPAFPFVTG